MKKTLFLLLFFNLAFFSYSQTSYKSGRTAHDKDSLARYRFEVGTDLLWLIDKNSLPGYCLQLKINTNSKKHPGAFRFKVGMDLKTKDSSWISSSDEYYRTIDESFFLCPGYQRNYTLGRVKLYWGADLHFLYGRKFLDMYSHRDTMNNTFFKSFLLNERTTMQYGVVGVAGITYQLVSRVSVSIESNISLIFNKRKYKYYYYYKEFPNDYTISGTEANILNVKFTPLSTINLVINF